MTTKGELNMKPGIPRATPSQKIKMIKELIEKIKRYEFDESDDYDNLRYGYEAIEAVVNE